MRTRQFSCLSARLALMADLFLAPVSLHATPLSVGMSKGPTRFPDGTTITVYIPEDPDPGGTRDASLAAGVLAWNSERLLLTHHIQIKVAKGTIPPGTKNAVQVNWEKPTTGTEFGEGQTSVVEGPLNNLSDGGMINIDPDTSDVNNTEASNLGIHEMGHILGLDDTPGTGDAMDPNFTGKKAIRITDTDTLELFSTFAAVNGGASSDHASATVNFDGSLYHYDYTLDYLSGVDLAMFQVDTNGADIEDIVAPTGWAVNSPIGPDVTVVADGAPQNHDFLSFVLRDEVHYLSPEYPELDFSFASTAAPGEVQAFLSGDFETPGPVLEPGAGWLALSGLVALLASRLVCAEGEDGQRIECRPD